jgi:oxygen-independent coproporphyrinogen-3 oxidase
MKPVSLYLHVPFCARSCPYCSFYHVTHSSELEEAFIDAACEEIRRIPDELGREVRLHTLYIGGGTPSVLTAHSMRVLRFALEPLMPEGGRPEFTVELNPEDVEESLLRRLLAMDVNRISLGVQSMDEAAQKKLQRSLPRTNERALSLARRYFDNINVDVLAGIPGCGLEELGTTMRRLVDYQTEHFSVYCLERGEDERPGSAEFFDEVDSGSLVDQYLFACDFLRERGYRHYEVSNFAVRGRESLHNLAYWAGDEYVGIGPAAHSFVNGRRYCNQPSLEGYLSSTTRAGAALRIYDDEGADRLLENVMLALRTDRGMPVEWIASSSPIVEELVEQGLATSSGGRLILSDKGFLLLDEIVVRICEEPGKLPQEPRYGRGGSPRRSLDSRIYYG